MTINSPGITAQDVARLAQVSVGTVSRVLKNQPNVDEKLRERVLSVVDELGYIHVPRKRRNLNEREDEITHKELSGEDATKPALKTLLFCVPVRKTPALQEAYFYQVLHGVEKECANSKIGVMYRVIDDNPQAASELKEVFEDGKADALIMVNYRSQPLIETLKSLNIPLVLIDPQLPVGLDVDLVYSDYFGASLAAMQFLVGLGHREIALVNGPQRYSNELRHHAYQIALSQAGISYRPELVVSNEQTPEGGQAALEELLSRVARVDAIYCANDNMALGVVQTLTLKGIKVPAEVSVIGFDDHGTATLATPPLTTLHADTSGKGSLAVRMLLERVAHPELPFHWSVIPLKLVERLSTARRG